MTYLVDPIVLTPTDWLQDQAHVERRPPAPTPGATGLQARIDWLSPLRAVVMLVRAFLWRTSIIVATIRLSAVRWLQVRLTLYDQSRLFFPLSFLFLCTPAEVF